MCPCGSFGSSASLSPILFEVHVLPQFLAIILIVQLPFRKLDLGQVVEWFDGHVQGVFFFWGGGGRFWEGLGDMLGRYLGLLGDIVT